MNYFRVFCSLALFSFYVFADDPVEAPVHDLAQDGEVTTNDVEVLEDGAPPVPYLAQAPQTPSTSVSFQGLGDNNVADPADTHGAVGPNHVMTMLNTETRIQDRTGLTNYLIRFRPNNDDSALGTLERLG